MPVGWENYLSAHSMEGDGEVHMLTDAVFDEPAGFGFEEHAKALAGLIADQEAKTPFTIAVHGGWGVGKSTLMKLVKHHLDNGIKIEGKKTVPVKTIMFNAWIFERQEPVWTALLETLIQEIGGKKGLSEKSRQVFKSAFLTSYQNSMDHEAVSKYVDEYPDIVKAMSELPEELGEEISSFINSSKNKYSRIVVFVDDLDKCQCYNAIEVLESMKLFLDIPNLVFVLSLDLEKVHDIIATHSNMDIGTSDYLDKIVQLQIQVPDIGNKDILDYIKSHAPSQFPEQFFQLMAFHMEGNTRKIKHIFNTLEFQYALAEQKENKVPRELVTLWVLIKYLYPYFAVNVERNPLILKRYNELVQITDMNTRNTFIEKHKLDPKDARNNNLLALFSLLNMNLTTEQIDEAILEAKSVPLINGRTSIDGFGKKDVLDLYHRGQNMSGMNLTGLDLSNIDLSGANLSGAMMSNVNLKGSNLAGANLTGAVLKGADLRGANLMDADLAGSNMSRTDLSSAILSNANITDSNLIWANLSNAMLWQAKLSKSNLLESNLTQANLSNASLSGADLSHSKMIGVQLTNTDLSETVLSGADLSMSDLSGADMSEAILSGAILVDANLLAANLWRAALLGTDLTRANLMGANLMGTNWSAANATGVKYDQKALASLDNTNWVEALWDEDVMEKLKGMYPQAC